MTWEIFISLGVQGNDLLIFVGLRVYFYIEKASFIHWKPSRSFTTQMFMLQILRSAYKLH
jgi:hypothetical protein